VMTRKRKPTTGPIDVTTTSGEVATRRVVEEHSMPPGQRGGFAASFFLVASHFFPRGHTFCSG
jgi:hypothetical protein